MDKVRHLQSRLRADKYDAAAWEQLIEELRNLSFNDVARSIYEELLSVFPTAALQWARYAEQEMNAGNYNNVKNIFGRCLLSCPNVDLWTAYLRFIKKVNQGKGQDGQLEIKKAFDFTLDCIGQDLSSGALWQEYLQFLQAPQPGSPEFLAFFATGVPGQEDPHRTAVIRKVYHRAIVVPTHSLDAIWKMYEQFENSVPNRQLGRKALDEQRPRYQHARQVLRERKRRMEGINHSLLPLPPGKGGALQESQARLWKEWVEFERSNPQRLDPGTLTARVSLAYEEALMFLWFYPEVWFEYSRWHLEGGGSGPNSAIQILTKSQKAVPTCVMLRFGLADLEEHQGNVQGAKQVYEALASQLESDSEQEAGPNKLTPELGGLIWIQYMRFSRRSENVKASRKLFLRAKKWPQCPWQVFAASALMEWVHAKDVMVARKIFEKGLENHSFLTNPDYILQYIDFLVSTGDTDNTRALFERVLMEDANKNNAKLWQKYVSFEYEAGDLNAAQQLEKRAKEAMGDDSTSALLLLVQRYKLLDLWPCNEDQRAHIEMLLGLSSQLPPMPPLINGGMFPPLGPFQMDLPPPSPEQFSFGPLDRAALGSPPGPPAPVPEFLGMFINSVGMPSLGMDGPTPDVDHLIDLILHTDLSDSAIIQMCAEAEGGPPMFGSMPGPGYPQMSPHSFGRSGTPPPMMPGMGPRGGGGFGPGGMMDDMMGMGHHKRKADGDPGMMGGDENGGPMGHMGGGQYMNHMGSSDVYKQRMKQRTRMVADN